MAIEKKPEQVTISGDDARAAIIDGVQRKLGRRIDEKTMRITTNPDGIRSPDANEVAITVDVLGARSGRKSSGGKPGRKPKSTSGSGGGTSNMGGTGSPGFTGTPPSAAS